MQNFQRRRVSSYGPDNNREQPGTYRDIDSMPPRDDPRDTDDELRRMQALKPNQRVTGQSTSCTRLKWYFRVYVYALHALVYEYILLLRRRGSAEDSSDAEEGLLSSLPFEAGFPLRMFTSMAVLWVVEFLYLRFHIFSIPVVVRGVAYLIFVLTIDALCYHVCVDLALGITIEACPLWVVGLILVEKLLTETLLRRLHYCPVGQGHIKDDLELFIEGLMTPPPPGCCGGTHRCARHRAAAPNQSANGHSHLHDHGHQHRHRHHSHQN